MELTVRCQEGGSGEQFVRESIQICVNAGDIGPHHHDRESHAQLVVGVTHHHGIIGMLFLCAFACLYVWGRSEKEDVTADE